MADRFMSLSELMNRYGVDAALTFYGDPTMASAVTPEQLQAYIRAQGPGIGLGGGQFTSGDWGAYDPANGGWNIANASDPYSVNLNAESGGGFFGGLADFARYTAPITLAALGGAYAGGAFGGTTPLASAYADPAAGWALDTAAMNTLPTTGGTAGIAGGSALPSGLSDIPGGTLPLVEDPSGVNWSGEVGPQGIPIAPNTSIYGTQASLLNTAKSGIGLTPLEAAGLKSAFGIGGGGGNQTPNPDQRSNGANTPAAALARLLGLDQNSQDVATILGPLLAGGVGYAAAGQQADALRQIASQQLTASEARYQDLKKTEAERWNQMTALQQQQLADAIKREEARYQDLKAVQQGNLQAAVEREQARYQDVVAREQARFNELKTRQDAEIARQQAAIGGGREATAPFQTRLQDYLEHPENYLKTMQPLLDQNAQSRARALSVEYGNPAMSPSAQGELGGYLQTLQNQWLGEEKNRLGTLGYSGPAAAAAYSVPGVQTGLPSSIYSGNAPQQNVSLPSGTTGQGTLYSGNPSAGASIEPFAGANTLSAATQAQTGGMQALGGMAADIFTPKQQFNLSDFFKQFKMT